MGIRCVLHGSFRRHFDEIKYVHQLFASSGIEVIAPDLSDIVGETDGFVHLASDESADPRLTELLYLKKVASLGSSGFSYYVNPDGLIGESASYELAIDQLTNTRSLFWKKPIHPAYVPKNSVWSPQSLASYVREKGEYPLPVFPKDESRLKKMVDQLILPGSKIAVGAIIVDYSGRRYKKGSEREVLLVKTHKWGDRFSIVGGKVRRNERLADALRREVSEETALEGKVEETICTFDEIKNSGYYQSGVHRVFTDNVVKAPRRSITLNDEAQSYLWIPPSVALKELDIEPNAKETLEFYIARHLRAA
jgi:ADP-ribose pyrophosphatase YjhB (NUDIX family)